MSGAALQAEALRGGPNLLIDGLHLHLTPGERVALISPNGSGKSTLLKLLARQLVPRGGAVYLHGQDLARLHALEREAREIAAPAEGRVFEDHRARARDLARHREPERTPA